MPKRYVKLSFIKTDNCCNPIPGFTYALKDRSGIHHKAFYTSSCDGTITFYLLTNHHYVITEMETPKGFVAATTPLHAYVDNFGKIFVNGKEVNGVFTIPTECTNPVSASIIEDPNDSNRYLITVEGLPNSDIYGEIKVDPDFVAQLDPNLVFTCLKAVGSVHTNALGIISMSVYKSLVTLSALAGITGIDFYQLADKSPDCASGCSNCVADDVCGKRRIGCPFTLPLTNVVRRKATSAPEFFQALNNYINS
jgi:hypothetical protein